VARNKRNPIKLAEKWEKKKKHYACGKDYEPFIRVWDFSSNGLRRRLTSWTAGRLHHLMSMNEIRAFYILDANPSVIDIREQYPLLPVLETKSIAASLGVLHSYGDIEHVYTTDFLVTLQGRMVAISIKPDRELLNKRTQQKMCIEREYWRRRDIEFRVVTDSQLCKKQALSIALVHRYRNHPLPMVRGEFNEVAEGIFKRNFHPHNQPISSICLDVDRDYGLRFGTALTVTKFCLANDYWRLRPGTFFSPRLQLKLEESIYA